MKFNNLNINSQIGNKNFSNIGYDLNQNINNNNNNNLTLSGKFKNFTNSLTNINLANCNNNTENINVNKKCIFRSNHASNYVSLRGDLPQDKQLMLDQLHDAMKNKGMLKDERFRAL